MPSLDAIVCGSVAVTRDGRRCGEKLGINKWPAEPMDWPVRSVGHRGWRARATSRLWHWLLQCDLRRKVEIDPAHPEGIRTVRGVGYMFVPPKN